MFLAEDDVTGEIISLLVWMTAGQGNVTKIIEVEATEIRVPNLLNFTAFGGILSQIAPSIKKLKLTNFTIDSSLTAVMCFCSQLLNSLNILVLRNDVLGSVSNPIMEHIFKFKTIDLSESSFDRRVVPCFENMNELKHLILYKSNADDSWIGDYINQLHILHLGKSWITMASFPTIVMNSKNLKSLYLCNIPLNVRDFGNIQEESFPLLEELCIYGSLINVHVIEKLLTILKKLKIMYVDLSIAHEFQNSSFKVRNAELSEKVKGLLLEHIHEHLY